MSKAGSVGEDVQEWRDKGEMLAEPPYTALKVSGSLHSAQWAPQWQSLPRLEWGPVRSFRSRETPVLPIVPGVGRPCGQPPSWLRKLRHPEITQLAMMKPRSKSVRAGSEDVFS